MVEYIIAACCYEGIIIFFALFLSWQIQGGSSPTLERSKDYAMAISNIAVVAIIGLVCTLIVDSTGEYNTLYIITAVCSIVSVTIAVFLVYGSKVSIFFICVDFLIVFSEKSHPGEKLVKKFFVDIRDGIWKVQQREKNDDWTLVIIDEIPPVGFYWVIILCFIITQ